MSNTVRSYKPVTTSGQITYSGLGNGTDFDSLIKKLVQVEQARITSLQTWKKSWTNKQTAFHELNTQMLTLKTSLEDMASIDEFLSKAADSSNSAVISAVAGAGAENGSHEVMVNRLATAKAMVTATGYASATADINPSSSDAVFAYTYKGTTYANTVGDNATLIGFQNMMDYNELARVDYNALKAATNVVAILPILCVYPLVLKYYTTDVFAGGVKD